MAALILLRHGQSDWNAQGLWTGLYDSPLTERGRQEARNAAEELRDIPLDKAYTSTLSRAHQTLDEIKQVLHCTQLPTVQATELNERNYGDYTGLNKWEIKEHVGEAEFDRIRRAWNHPVPGGETLKEVSARVLPYYRTHLLPDLQAGQNVLVVAHGNSLRALMKHLGKVKVADIQQLEIGTGEVVVYDIAPTGQVLSKTVRATGGKA